MWRRIEYQRAISPFYLEQDSTTSSAHAEAAEEGFELKIRIAEENASIEVYQNPEGIWKSKYTGMLTRQMIQQAAREFIKHATEFRKAHPDTPQPILFYFNPSRFISFGTNDFFDLKEVYNQINGGTFIVIEMELKFAPILFNTVMITTTLLPNMVSHNQIYTLNYMGKEAAGLRYAREIIERKKQTKKS